MDGEGSVWATNKKLALKNLYAILKVSYHKSDFTHLAKTKEVQKIVS